MLLTGFPPGISGRIRPGFIQGFLLGSSRDSFQDFFGFEFFFVIPPRIYSEIFPEIGSLLIIFPGFFSGLIQVEVDRSSGLFGSIVYHISEWKNMLQRSTRMSKIDLKKATRFLVFSLRKDSGLPES